MTNNKSIPNMKKMLGGDANTACGTAKI